MRKILILFALVAFSAPGCMLLGPNKYESYRPVIPAIPIYPGNKDKTTFYADQKQLLERIKAKPQAPTPEMVELLRMTYDLDTLLQMREKQIEAYNGWAKTQNEKNGYKGPELP